LLPFKPSNVDAGNYAGRVVGNIEVKYQPIDSSILKAQIDTDALLFTYADDKKSGVQTLDPNAVPFVLEARSQADSGGPDVAVFVIRSLFIDKGQSLYVTGSRPLVILASDSVRIDGFIEVHSGACPGPSGSTGWAGVDGLGPGGGSAGTNDVAMGGGGGGGYCTAGGNGGGDYEKDSGGVGGKPYGNAELIPLMGGSTGAQARLSYNAGAGGGALQVSAGAIVLSGYITAPGGGGTQDKGWGGSGAGSGGAIVLEGSTIKLDGVVAANGGAGGQDYYDGSAGQPSGVVAGGIACGGDGAAGNVPARDGLNDSDPNCHASGGGGGGAGRIRLNTESGQIEQSGQSVVSPALASGCASVGKVNH
jgi:hypothetical protein